MVQRSGLSLPCVAVLAGRVLDASVRVCELGLSAHSHLVLLSSALPRKEALAAAAAAAAAHSRPLFDPAAVSGMLAQLNLQFQPQQQQQVQQQQQQQQQQRPRFSPQHEALLLELMEMGFSRNRAEHAVLAAGNNASLERCSEWIVETIDVNRRKSCFCCVFFFNQKDRMQLLSFLL